MLKASTADVVDSHKYGRHDSYLRSVLVNDFLVPTPLVNLVSEYGDSLYEKWTSCPCKIDNFTDALPWLEFIDNGRNFLYPGLLMNRNTVAKTLPIIFQDVCFLKGIEKLGPNNILCLYVQLNERQCNSMKSLILAVATRLEAFHKHYFPFLTFTDDVDLNIKQILGCHVRFMMKNSSMLLKIITNKDSGYPQIVIQNNYMEIYEHVEHRAKEFAEMKEFYTTPDDVLPIIPANSRGNVIFEVTGVAVTNNRWRLFIRVTHVNINPVEYL